MKQETLQLRQQIEQVASLPSPPPPPPRVWQPFPDPCISCLLRRVLLSRARAQGPRKTGFCTASSAGEDCFRRDGIAPSTQVCAHRQCRS